MLILTRKPNETFFINTPTGDKISVTLLSFRGRQARIGINAPEEYNIVREELLTRDRDVSEGFRQMEAIGHCSEEQIALDQQEAFSSLDGGRARKRVFKSP